jgi:hypothetical protein
MQIVLPQAKTGTLPIKDFDLVPCAIDEHEELSTVRICGTPHIHSYVSGVIMWRRVFAARYSATKPSFAAT